jgi:predicted enzyme related to lactoylglutathione lyase
MLNNGTVTANVPAGDLKRARDFYDGTLGLTPSFEVEGIMMIYKTAGGSMFSIYETQYAGQAGHTIAQWHVDDVEQEVNDLKAKGVTFEEYDLPGVKWQDGIATLEGMGKAAWFKDSEGNVLCIDEGLPGV